MRLELGVEAVNDPVPDQAGAGDACAVFFAAINLPGASLFDKAHLVSASPPIVKLAGKRNPYFGLTAELSETREKGGVNLAGAFIEQIIGMDDEADQPVLLENQCNLLIPKIHRVLA